MGSRSEPAPARGRGRRYDTTTATATSVRLAWAGPSWSDANGRAECVRQATHSASASAGIFACRDEALLHSHHGQLVARTHGRRTIEVIMKARLVPAWLPFMSTEAREGGEKRHEWAQSHGSTVHRVAAPGRIWCVRIERSRCGVWVSSWSWLPTPTRARNEQAAPRKEGRKREERRQSTAPQQNDQRPHTWCGPVPGKVDVDWELDRTKSKTEDERSA